MIQCRDHITTLTSLTVKTSHFQVSDCWSKPSSSFGMVTKGHVRAELQNYSGIILKVIVSGNTLQSAKIQNHVLPPSAQWPLRREPFVSF